MWSEIAVEMLAHKKYELWRVSVTYSTMNQIGWWHVLRHDLAVLTSGPGGEKSSPGCFVDGPALDSKRISVDMMIDTTLCMVFPSVLLLCFVSISIKRL